MTCQNNNRNYTERQMHTKKDGRKWLHLDDDMGYQSGFSHIIKAHKFTLITLSIFVFGVISGRVYNDHSYSLIIALAITFLLIPSTIECYHSRFIAAKLFSYIVIFIFLFYAAIWVFGSRGGIFPLW